MFSQAFVCSRGKRGGCQVRGDEWLPGRGSPIFHRESPIFHRSGSPISHRGSPIFHKGFSHFQGASHFSQGVSHFPRGQWWIQDFPEEVAPTPQGRCQHTVLPNFPRKLHEMKRILMPRRAGVLLVPPRSANGGSPIFQKMGDSTPNMGIWSMCSWYASYYQWRI